MQIELESSSTLAEAAYDDEHNNDNPKLQQTAHTNDYNTQQQQEAEEFQHNNDNKQFQLTDLRADMINMDSITSPILLNHKIPFVYCDHTASNRALHSIEDYIHQNVLPLYANVHTTTSTSGSQSTALVSESRTIIAEACNARITGKASRDVVLFTGSGATSAVELALQLTLKSFSKKKKVVVFAGPMEHHSNLLPYRESDVCEVVNVPPMSGRNGGVDLKALEDLLKLRTGADDDGTTLKIGVFSAASNVTGMICPVMQITQLLHKYNALSFWDYATASPYTPIDMNPTSDTDAHIDALFLSTHKLVGGINTPGVLIIKKFLVDRFVPPPSRIGGGTVFYTTEDETLYTTSWVDRNEGGTPNVVGCIRAGLTFLVRKKLFAINYLSEYSHLCDELGFVEMKERAIGDDLNITAYECLVRNLCVKYLKEHAPNLVLLGDLGCEDANDGVDHLPILSFLIRCGERFLHYNYVCALLNDLFGIQSRGGCQCAGPYAQRLMGLSIQKNGKYMSTAANKNILDALINDKAELLRPGFTRLSLNYTLSPQEIHYTLKSIVWVCRNAYKLCGSGIYAMNSRTGEWRHQSRQGRPLGFERIWLSHYNEKPLSSSMNGDKKSVIVASSLAENIERANDILETLSATKPSAVAELYDEVRWFLTPADCALLMTANAQSNHSFCPVSPSLLGAIQPPDQTNPASPIDDSVTNTSFANVVSKLYPFRDGDSAGEATLEEIFEGYDDGELSDACVVFVDDEWIGVKSAQNTSKVIVNNNLCTNYSAEKVEGPPPAEESLPIEEQKSHVDVALEMDQFFPGSDIAEPKKPRKRKFIVPPKKFLGPIKKALIEHEMIAENDVLLLGLSGGKDSLSLLHILIYLQTKLPQKFTLKVLTVDPMSSGFDPSSLIDYIASLRDGYGNEIEYHYVRDDIMGRAYENNYGGDEKKRVTSICAYCARMKRGIMYSTMRKCGANKLVLAQHLDDLVESTMMSIMHNGFLRTMKTHYTINIGDLAVIRPLSYTRESELTQFALANNLPVINENCPACFEEPKERARIKKLLSREENLFSNLYDNMRKAILPLMHADTESIMWSYTNMITEKSNKEKKQERKKLLREQKKRAQSNGGQNDNVDNETKIPDVTGNSNPHIPKLLSEVPEGELVVELARRRAAKFALKGSLQKTAEAKNTDEAPVCSINGGPGTVPCYQLME